MPFIGARFCREVDTVKKELFALPGLPRSMKSIGPVPCFQNIVKGLVPVLSVFVTIDRRKIGIIK